MGYIILLLMGYGLWQFVCYFYCDYRDCKESVRKLRKESEKIEKIMNRHSKKSKCGMKIDDIENDSIERESEEFYEMCLLNEDSIFFK